MADGQTDEDFNGVITKKGKSFRVSCWFDIKNKF